MVVLSRRSFHGFRPGGKLNASPGVEGKEAGKRHKMADEGRVEVPGVVESVGLDV